MGFIGLGLTLPSHAAGRFVLRSFVVCLVASVGANICGQVRPTRERPITVRGGVVTYASDGRPAPGTTVTLRSLNYTGRDRFGFEDDRPAVRDRVTTVTDSSGGFLLSTQLDWADVVSWVEARTTDGLVGTDTWTSQPVDRPELNLSVVLRPQRRVVGQVVNELGKPVPGAGVRLMRRRDEVHGADSGGAVRHKAITTEQGYFFFEVLEGLEYLVTSDVPGYLPVNLTFVPSETTLTLTLTPGGAKVQATLLEYGTNHPIAHTSVTLLRTEFDKKSRLPAQVSQSVTDGQGTLNIGPLLGGTYRIQLGNPNLRIYSGSGSVNTTIPPRSDQPLLNVAADQSTHGLVLYAFRGHELEGVVVDDRGQPLQGVEVRAGSSPGIRIARPAEPDQTRDVTTTQGRFLVRSWGPNITTAAGSFHMLTATREGMTLQKSKKLEASIGLGPSGGYLVPLKPGQVRYEGIRIVLEKQITLSGRVVTDGGVPVADAEIRGVNLDPPSEPGTRRKPNQTDSQGKFQIPVERQRSYRVEAVHPTLGSSQVRSVRMFDTAEDLGDLVLRIQAADPTDSDSGGVISPNGQPVQ